MRSIIAVLLIAAVFALVSSHPPDTFNPRKGDDAQPAAHQTVDVEEHDPEQHIRHKRFTCDVGSAFNVNHALCAGHCLLKGFRGGWCDNRAVCNCRH